MATIQTNVDEQILRETAYLIWEEAGRPFGQEDLHWRIAKELTAKTDVPTPQAAIPKTAARKKRTAAEAPGSSAKPGRKGASTRDNTGNTVFQ